MRWFAAIVLVVGFSAIAAIAQIAPISYGFSSSSIDHNGRVLIFEGTYLYPPMPPVQPLAVRFPPKVTTQVSVIESDASSKADSQYDGIFQVVGVGRYAVYAIVTDYSIGVTTPQGSTSVTRRLVALGPLFPALPSVDVPLQADVKVSAVGDDGAPDTIAFIGNVPTPVIATATGTMGPLPSIPTQPRIVQMLRSDGKSFTPLPPITVSNP
jgi:hypothetical protein